MSKYTKTTTTGFGTRIKNALSGIIVGPILVIASIYFIFSNEANSVQTARSLAEGAGQVVELESLTPDATHEGHLVHITGPVTLGSQLEDTVLGITAGIQSVRLDRTVEQYAWVEESRTTKTNNTGGSQTTRTEYSYNKEWVENPSSGHDFHVSSGHTNPPMPIESARFNHQTGQIGSFTISQGISSIGTSESINISTKQAANIQTALQSNTPAQVTAGTVQFSENVAQPRLGDIRISFTTSDVEEASVVGSQQQGTLIPHTTSNGRDIFLIDDGRMPAATMFADAQSANKIKTWIFRAGLLLAMFIGFKLLLSVVDVLASFLPFLGWMTSSVTTLISIALTLILGGGAMAIAWFAFRPVLSLVIIGVAAAIAVGLTAMAKKRASATGTDAPA
jgi:hypothetical protein